MGATPDSGTPRNRDAAALFTEFTAAGNADRWRLLRKFLTSDRDLSGLAEIAVQLCMTEPGVKSAILLLRKRQAEVFRE